MTLDEIKELCKHYSEMVGDEFNIPVIINARLSRALGRHISKKNGDYLTPDRIEIARVLIETCTDKTITDVVGHEWAHYYATKLTHVAHGHDDYFRSICALIGCENDRSSTDVERTVEVKFKYDIYCPTCDRVIDHYKRMCDTIRNIDQCYCNDCKNGGLKVNQNW